MDRKVIRNYSYLISVFLLVVLVSTTNSCAQPKDQMKKNEAQDIPEPVAGFIGAVNKSDEQAVLSFFDEKQGVVDDWGRRFEGHTAIKEWSDKEFIGAKGTITPQRWEVSGNEVTLWAGWKSNFYSGDSKFIFVVDGKKLKEMRIVSAK